MKSLYTSMSANHCCSRNDYLPVITENGEIKCNEMSRKGRVISWSESFDTLLNDSIGLKAFTEFLRQEFSEENINFWLEAKAFSKISHNKKILKEANYIYKKYVSVSAEHPVNIDSKARLEAEVNLKNPKKNMFEASEKQIYNLMKSDSYRRFLESYLYSEYLKCEIHNKYPFTSNQETETIHRRELRRSIVPWQRAKQFKPRLSLSGSSARKIVNHLSRLKSVKKSESKAVDSENLECSISSKKSPKIKMDPVKTNKTVKNEVCKEQKVSTLKTKKENHSELPTNVDNLIDATNSDISFSDDTKSEAFFSDLMLMSQKTPFNAKSSLSSAITERSLMKRRNRNSVLIESQVAFFPSAYVSKSKIYV